ncbi:SGNH/GDSL hydrolase family protein [Cohnella sp.]|uniref:SGNH/GDSL hydrolase family protein n=1 Tax=Cohnella sp. TaxID=1883426 RepID=UPI0035699D18
MQRFGICFHNVAELEARPGLSGLILQRFPQEVRHSLTAKGRTKAEQSNGCELRFVTESVQVQITAGSRETDGTILVFRGDFFHSFHQLRAGVAETISLEIPDRFADVEQAKLNGPLFAPNVWRIFFDRFGGVFHELNAYGYPVRPPSREEMPRRKLLAYGSSITQGAGAMSHYNGYAQQAARRLGLDVLNLGLSGSCFCEREVADHIAGREDWDAAFLELGVNMRGAVPAEEFARRTSYLFDRIMERHPDKPIFATTIYPNRATYSRQSGHPHQDAEQEYNEILRAYAASRAGSRLHLFEGDRIMSDFSFLTSDLIHPSEYGHIRMGENLENLMSPLLSGYFD